MQPFFLMYAQIFLVTSVRGSVLAPQIATLRAEGLRREDALPRLLHRKRVLLTGRALRRIALGPLLSLDRLQSCLRDRRLRGLGRGNRRLRGGRHSGKRMEMQARLEP